MIRYLRYLSYYKSVLSKAFSKKKGRGEGISKFCKEFKLNIICKCLNFLISKYPKVGSGKGYGTKTLLTVSG